MFEKFNKFMGLVREGLQYSLFEGLYLITLLIDLAIDGEITTWYAAIGAMLAFVWVLATTTQEARAEMRTLVLHRDVFMTDFWVSAFILTLIAITVRNEHLLIVSPILLAIGQNLRYSYVSMQWLLEERRERQRKEGHPDNDMS